MLILSAVVAFVATPLVRRLALRWGAVDHPDARKLHARPTARLGGLAIFAGFCLPLAGLYLRQNRVSLRFQDYETLLAALMVGATAILALGIYDDLRGANARQKLVVQCAVAVGIYACGWQITRLSNPMGEAVALGWLALPVSVAWVVGVTNAMNLLDGIDGLATGVAACISLSLAAINIYHDNTLVALLTLCLAGASLGFLPHNFAPARIFLGDTGSLFLGFMLACIGIVSLFKAVTAVFVLAPLLLFGLPIADASAVMFGRWRRRAPLFQADRSHVHHRLLRRGWTHRQAALFLYAVTAALATFAVALSVRQMPWLLLLGVGQILVLCLVLWRAKPAATNGRADAERRSRVA
jgi:UDP-GlcNAc:undecaprenyl-phosphate GlcNAc-1-phosphate transferase